MAIKKGTEFYNVDAAISEAFKLSFLSQMEELSAQRVITSTDLIRDLKEKDIKQEIENYLNFQNVLI